ncbi:MAG: hypothetical protein HKL96_09005 [Phycisphaerales bacterium]|nr:hypothetical protein [Phycisphaerales bacterium]
MMQGTARSLLLTVLVLSAVACRRTPETTLSSPQPTTTTKAQSPARAPATSPAMQSQLGVYRGSAGANGPAKVNAFSQWMGRRTLWAEDFMDNSSWDSIAMPNWQTGPWEKWVAERAGRRLVLSVPMLPGPWDQSGPTAGTLGLHHSVSFADGAKGDYDKYFKMLARNLVAHHLANAILRLGWEFNGGWYTWRAQGQSRLFITYWRRIVTTMRSVPGASRLQFCWNPTVSYVQFPAAQAWPGRKYVNYIGVDVYDQSWLRGTYPFPTHATPAIILLRQKAAWQGIYSGNQGLLYWAGFAKQHRVALAIPEWGVDNRSDGHGGLDDPYFIRQMHKFMTDPAHHVAFDVYFDYRAPDGDHQLSPGLSGWRTQFPRSAAAFRKLFAWSR